MRTKRHGVAVIVGTRPEAIKLAPVIRLLARSRKLAPVTVLTGQHRDMAEETLRDFGLRVSWNLRVMRRAQTLWGLTARLVTQLGSFLATQPVKAVLVQGDTSSALIGGLCAFYHQLPIGHVEAGLRTGDRSAPFPEEMNRKLLASLATWHFAPTRGAMDRLREEGVPARSRYLTGNTVVDALQWMLPRSDRRVWQELLGADAGRRRVVLVTCHRRENFGAPLEAIGRGLARIAREHPDVTILFPVHPNPAVRRVVWGELGVLPNAVLCEPLNYARFLACLKRSYMVITDSGGVQEEATALGKPVLVLRSRTERPEGIRAGPLQLVGTISSRIAGAARQLLRDERAYRRMCRAAAVFGDGHAAERIVRVLEAAAGNFK